MKKLLLTLSLLATLTSHAATLAGRLADVTGNPQAPYVRLIPRSTPVASGNSTVLGYSKRMTVSTNGNYSVTNVLGGYYDTDFGDAALPLLRILVPLNDTNTYTLNQVAQLAVNAAMFIPGSNIVITVNSGSGTGLNTNAPLVMAGGATLGTNGTITLGVGSSQNVLTPSAGLVNFSQGINASGNVIIGHHFYGDDFTGSGALLTGITSNGITSINPSQIYPAISTSGITNTQAGVTLSGTFTGNGAGLVNTPAHPVNNVMLFGATGTNNWPLDTAAFGAAFTAMMRTNGYPVYFPNGIYGISNYVIGSPFNYTSNNAEFSGVRIIGNFGFSQLVPVGANSILTFTNAMNNVRLESLSFNGAGKSVSAPPMVLVRGHGGSTDNLVVKDCWFQNSWLGLQVEATSDSHFENCSFAYNHRPIWFSHDPDLVSPESNNNDFFMGGFIGANDLGMSVDDGSLVFNGVEGGAVGQTNFMVCTNTSQINIHFFGGNIELDAGAVVLTTNSGNAVITIDGAARMVDAGQGHAPRLANFQDNGTAFSSLTVMSCSLGNFMNARVGVNGASPIVKNLTSASQLFQLERVGVSTNYVGSVPSSTLNPIFGSGSTYNNFFVKENYDALGRSHLYFGTGSNNASFATGNYFFADLTKYSFDVQDGLLPSTTASNAWTGFQTVGYSAASTITYPLQLVNGGGGAGSGAGIRFYNYNYEGAPNYQRQGTIDVTYPTNYAGYAANMNFAVNSGANATSITNLLTLDGFSKVVSIGGKLLANAGSLTNVPVPDGTPVTLAQTATANNEDWSSGNQTMVSKLFNGLALSLPPTFRVVVAVGHHGCLLSNVCVKIVPPNSAAGTAFSASTTLSNRITFSAATGAAITANQWFLTNTAANGGLIYSDPISIPVTMTNDYWFYAYLPNAAPNTYSGSGSDGTVQWWNSSVARSGTTMSVLNGDTFAGDLTTASVTPADPSVTKWYLFKALVK